MGLRRSGLAANHDGAELKQLQEVWTLMYRSDLVIADALQQARSQPLLPAAEHFCRFLEASTAARADGVRCRCRAADGSAADQHRRGFR